MKAQPVCPKCGHPEFDWTIKAFGGERYIMVFCKADGCNAAIGVTLASDTVKKMKK